MLLDPVTGRCERRIYLCGTGSGAFDSLYTLMPCITDGIVYIPTGRGMLIALETPTWSVQWAVRYESENNDALNTGWLPTPVIAVADVVLLAPGDADKLFCFDRSTGALRWHINRGDYLYLLGATDHHAWIAGNSIKMLDLENGKTLWEKPCSQPTGRGVIADERIYLPTINGLAAFHADTGDEIPIEQPITPITLGNLLAWDSALYSLTNLRVSKFPDLNMGYQKAVAQQAADPSNPTKTIRLAWMEYLKNRPSEALALLENLPRQLKENKQQQYHDVIHLQVLCMLDEAAKYDDSPAKALELLRHAQSIALTDEDAITSSLALGDFYYHQNKFLDACQQYLSLALSEQGDYIMAQDSGIERQTLITANQRIADISNQLSEDDRASLNHFIRTWMDHAAVNFDEQSLTRLTRCLAMPEWTGQAELLLGNWAKDDLRYEKAENHYQQVLRICPSTRCMAEAAARLATIYLEPDDLHLPLAASKLLDRLSEEFAEVELPANLVNPEERSPKTIPAAQVASELRQRIDSDTLAYHQSAVEPVEIKQLDKPAETIYQNARLLSVRGPRSEPLIDKQLLLVENNKVEAHSLSRNELLWPAELRLLGEFSVETEDLRPIPYGLRANRNQTYQLARGVIDGQSLMVNSEYGIHAIGLLTGRRLWSQQFDPPHFSRLPLSGSDTWIWAHNGYVISVDARHQIKVARVNDGNHILWRCKMPDHNWFAIRARGDHLVAVDSELEKVDVFHLEKARYLGMCRFQQNFEQIRKTNLSLFDDVICGPVSVHQITARNLANPGIERWRLSVPNELSQIFKPTPDLLAVTDHSGHIKVIDPNNGKIMMSANVSQACSNGITEGVLENNILYVYGYQTRFESSTDYDKQKRGLAAIDFTTGKIIWQISGIPARTYMSADIMRACTNVIPLAELLPNQGANSKRDFDQIRLNLIDKSTGQPVGEAISAPIKDSNAGYIYEVQVRPDCLIVISNTSHLRFSINR